MCRNGQYTERGIKQIHGFMSERWRIEPEYAIKIDAALGILGVLLEPTTVVTKAWEHALAVGRRAFWEPRTVLVTGAGPIGLLAALLGVQLGLEVHVLDRSQSGLKPELVRALGATYHSSGVADVGFAPDIVMECTGAGEVISSSISRVAASGIVCLAGVGHGGPLPTMPMADIATCTVLKNNIVIGSVNANKRHWYKATEALARAERSWLGRLITGKGRPEDFASALGRGAQHIKFVIQFADV
jgi:threonine dehydrogenase-like Zn-dependent dehydrogenase